jgi:putative two-component system response regulator
MSKAKRKILIVDDSEMNRDILSEMLGDEYDIIEACDGAQAVAVLQKQSVNIDLVLLDIVMPIMDGYDVLAFMNSCRLIDDIPVIMISSENSQTHIERAYELGVTDFISRPFDALVVRRRVVNTIMLYAKQKKLVGMVADQIYEKEKNSSMMINILSHIVEFRNGESGLHILHVQTITDILLKRLVQISDKYTLSQADIALIGTASSLHDIGKISIPDEILNKPGKLTKEEFEVMKTHSMAGASVLSELTVYKDEPLLKYAYDICRWHHERYDGRGYPDGLKGDDIPISAQIVALADVYDALTSDRVYKKAFSHETAMNMILNGECGTFNPLLLDCLKDAADTIRNELRLNSIGYTVDNDMKNLSAELLSYEELSSSERALQMLEYERIKNSFYSSLTPTIQFEYTKNPSMTIVNPYGADKLGIPEVTMHRGGTVTLCPAITNDDLKNLVICLGRTTCDQPITQYDCKVNIKGEWQDMRFICRSIWSADINPVMTGVIGKIALISEQTSDIKTDKMIPYDALTGLMNYDYAKIFMQELVCKKAAGRFAMAIIDVDGFKAINRIYGSEFGDNLLMHIAQKLRKNVESRGISSRVGGDEFVIFVECSDNPQDEIGTIVSKLVNTQDIYPISVSVGAVTTEQSGIDCSALFGMANRALYAAKKVGKAQLKFYDDSMRDMLSEISPIK